MDKIFFLLERVYRMTHIPVRYIDKTSEMVLLCRGYETKHDPLSCDEELRNSIIKKLKVNALPILEFEDEFLYGACMDSIECSIILGPIRTGAVDSIHMSRYATKHHVPVNNIAIIHRTMDALSAVLSLVHYTITGKIATETEIISNRSATVNSSEAVENAYQEYELETAENETVRFNFSNEMDFTKLIRDGDSVSIKQQIDSQIGSMDVNSIGKLAQKNFKQHEYFLASVITLASRAAIDGGLDPAIAFLMSDLFFQRLESSKEIPEMYSLLQDVMLDYAERVRQKQEDRSQLSYVEKCKNYISKHLNKPFTVDHIATEIGLNKSYLSRRFSEAEGVGIQQYAQQKRIDAAANMLKFSDVGLLSISNYLCFTSQSHFGKVFKEYKGITPQKYREKHRLDDFKT